MRWRMFSTEIFSKRSTMLSRWEKCWRREICIPQFFHRYAYYHQEPVLHLLLLLQPPYSVSYHNSQMTRKYVGHSNEEDGRKLQMSHVWDTSNLYPYVFYRYFSFPAALQHSKIRNGWRYDR